MTDILMFNQDLNTIETNKLYDVIIMNPPFVGVGEKFIQKCMELLKPGGYLGCVMSPTWRSVVLPKNQHKKTYSRMVREGEFIMIHMYSPSDTTKAFGKNIGQVDTFVWRKND